ncbi:MAG TPA: hypothetical protein VHA56_06920 [Mucilaginibacter sp.]|nr:hypothetical protein [Mucilaginibacter sp.]
MKVNVKSNTPAFSLNRVDPEDIEDVLLKIQRSFDIRFEDEDLQGVKTFGQLCDAVVHKLKDKQHNGGCTTQHAFYKLRHAINASVDVDKDLVKPHTKLCDIFPRDTRLKVISEVEKEMGFEMNLLKPKGAVVFTFSLILGASVVGLFFFPVIAGVGALLAISGLLLAGKFGKEMPARTLGDLAEKISREHYRSCRRHAETINRSEVSEKIKELFVHELYLEPSVITRESRFNQI